MKSTDVHIVEQEGMQHKRAQPVVQYEVSLILYQTRTHLC